MPGHLRTTKVWLPSWVNSFSMSLCMTRIAVMTTMMEKTPTSTPSKVRLERNLWAASALMAMRKLSRSSAAMMVVRLLISQRVDGIHAGGAPGGEKARQNAGGQRDAQGDTD